MRSPRRSIRLPIALLHLNDNMRNTLSLFFESRLCPIDVDVVAPGNAEIGIFDYDHPLSRDEADAWLTYREEHAVILMSLHSLDKPGAICLRKPVKPKELLAVLERLASAKAQSVATPPPPPVLKPDPAASAAIPGERREARPTASAEAPSTNIEEMPSVQPAKAAAETAVVEMSMESAHPESPPPSRHDAAKRADPAQAAQPNDAEDSTEHDTTAPARDKTSRAHGGEEGKRDNAKKTAKVVDLPSGRPVAATEDLDKLLEEVNWQLDFGDINKAREMLEAALEAAPDQSILHHEILQLYGWTSDHEHFYAMYEKLDMNDAPYAEKWVKLKEFFDQIDRA